MGPALRVGLLVLVAALAGCRGSAQEPRHAPPGKPPAGPRAQRTWPLTLKAYPWPHAQTEYVPLAAKFPPPPGGCRRIAVKDRSWAQWLRHLPLRPDGASVVGLDRRVIVPAGHPNLAAVVDIDLRKDQECNDTIQRLRAEYLRWAGREKGIVFSTGEGGRLSWPEWKRGVRPHYDGHRLSFSRSGQPGGSRASFDRYLAAVCAWCGTDSLAADGKPVKPSDIRIGDYFVHGGQPGHCVLIVDLARDPAGRLRALIAQGYKPAQSAHVLAPDATGPWFDLDPRRPVVTPFWGEFRWSELRRFRTEG